jgi:hypothetical protein
MHPKYRKQRILYQFDNKNILLTAYVIVRERNYVDITDEIRKPRN